MNTAILKAWLLNPAFLLALVPLVKLGVECLFRRGLGNSTLESLNRAANPASDMVEATKHAIQGANLAQGEGIRKTLTSYVDNAAKLEKFFETCLFTAFSLAVWWLTEEKKQEYQQVINIILLFVIIVALVIVGIGASQNKYESARIDAVKNPSRFAFVLNLVVVILESVSKLTGH
jgi:cytochrome bd-type quinol oxidase subunit 2